MFCGIIHFFNNSNYSCLNERIKVKRIMVKRKKKDSYQSTDTKSAKLESGVCRCDWVSTDVEYIAYHDNEWGQPNFNSVNLFEMLCLEGQQAGLSWITVLKKREHYRRLFFNFNPHKISELSKSDIDKFICDPGVIRHRGKLEAIVHNSKCYLKMEADGTDFSEFVWSFVNKAPVVNSWSNVKDVPTQTETSIALSNALKKKDFKFVGSTICYAFMQACGLVNDHIVNCICHPNINE